MKVDNKQVNKAVAANKKKAAKKKLPDLKNLSMPTLDDLKNFDFSSVDRKKAIISGVAVLIVIILLRGVAGMKSASPVPPTSDPAAVSTEAPAFGELTVDDVMTAKVERPYTGKTAKNLDLDKLIPILNNVMFVESTEPLPEGAIKGTYFTLYLDEGGKITIVAADNYLTIDGAGWKVDAQSYNDLVEFATNALKKGK